MWSQVGSGLVNYLEQDEIFLRWPISEVKEAMLERDAENARSHKSRGAVSLERTRIPCDTMDDMLRGFQKLPGKEKQGKTW